MKLSLLLFFLSCLFQSGLFSDSTSKNPILIGASFNESYLGKYLLYLEDRKHSSVEEAKNSSNWIYKPGNEISFGFTDSSYWARFTLKNNSLFENLYLECNVATIDEIEIFIPKDGKFLSKISGDMHSFRSREIPYRTFIFNIPVKHNETKEFFIRLNNKGPMKFSFILQSPAAFSEKIFRDQVILGIYYGAAIIIILYNFFLFLSLRDINYLNYVLYVASVGTYQMIINGHVAQFILKDSPLIVNLLPNIVANLSFFTGVLFSRKFLESKKYSPLTDKILIGLMFIAVMLIALTITTGHHSILIKTSNILGLLVMLSLITTGYLCLKKNYKPARFFLIGWSVLLFTVLIQIFSNLGILDLTAEHVVQIGSGLEILLLSFALTDRLRSNSGKHEELPTRTKPQPEEFQNTKRRPLFTVLQTNYKLTYHEAKVCDELINGKSRKEIAVIMGIQSNTLKRHLSSIYEKTINQMESENVPGQEKLQKLTLFLQNLERTNLRGEK